MIDYIKLWVRDEQYQRSLLHNPEVAMSYSTVETFHKGKVKSSLQTTGSIRGMKLKLYNSGLTEISGSIHKYLNYDEFSDDSHNYDDFTYDRLSYSIDDLMDRLELSPDKLSIHNIEIGVNIDLGIPPQDYFDKVLNHKYKLPETKHFGGKGYLLQWQYDDYIVKNYHKQLQYGLDRQIVRFELKVMAMKHLNRLGHYYLSDLKNPEILLHFCSKLVEAFSNVMFIEHVPRFKLSPMELNQYTNYIDRFYWRDLSLNSKRTKVRRHKRNYNNLIASHIQYPLGARVIDEIKNKFEMLLVNKRDIA